MRRSTRRKITQFFVLILIVGSIGAVAYFLLEKKEEQTISEEKREIEKEILEKEEEKAEITKIDEEYRKKMNDEKQKKLEEERQREKYKEVQNIYWNNIDKYKADIWPKIYNYCENWYSNEKRKVEGEQQNKLNKCLSEVEETNKRVAEAGSDHHCIGSTNKIYIKNIKEQIKTIFVKDLKIGDKIKCFKNNKIIWDTVIAIGKHDNIEPLMLKFVFTNNEFIILAVTHLIYNGEGNIVRPDTLKVGDYIQNISNNIISKKKIEKIDKLFDIPLSPITVSGNFILDNGYLVSCWSHSKANADKLDLCVKVYKNLENKLPYKVTEFLVGIGYESIYKKKLINMDIKNLKTYLSSNKLYIDFFTNMIGIVKDITLKKLYNCFKSLKI